MGRMPNTTELILFLLASVVFVVLVGLEERTRERKRADRTRIPDVEDSIMRYSSAIHWFRDFWSNRQKLKRNKKGDDFDIDTGSRTEGELLLEEIGDGRCDVHGLGGRFRDLANPNSLVRRHEPHGIVIADVVGRELYQLPESWDEYMGAERTRLSVRGEFKWLNGLLQRSGPVPAPEEVYAEPLVQAKGRLPLAFAYVAVMIIWLTSIILRYLTAFLPWVEPINLPIMVLASVVYVSLLASHVISEATAELEDGSATIYLYDGKRPDKCYNHPGDIPRWLEAKVYWVLRYLFKWRCELTVNKDFPFIHLKIPDLERVEVWLDAKTGAVEWIVSDYHWRELWYKAGPNLRVIRAWIFPNFHTPRPLTIETEGKGELRDLYVQEHRLKQAWKNHKLEHTLLLHPKHWIALQIRESTLSPIVDELSTLWWDKWRYPHGLDNDYYRKEDGEYHAAVGDQPPSQDEGNVLGVVTKELEFKKKYLVECQDQHERVCGVRGETLILKGTAVCVSTRDSQSGDIILRYTGPEAELLMRNDRLTISK